MENYGAAPSNEKPKGLYGSGTKQRMNVVAVFLSLMVPWILFCTVYAACSFSMRRAKPGQYWTIILLALSSVGLCFALALGAVKKKMSDETYQPTWYIILAVTSLVAFLLAYIGGHINFTMNMAGYYDLQNLNDMMYVDPARMRGQQMMDVGRATFVNGTHLDGRFAMGFTNGDVYCVAPITSGPAPLSNYDFWAVGINCCTGSAGSFHCPNYDNANAQSGLRVVADAPRAFYRLAVQQAAATFNIQANHPLFFQWTTDASAEQAAGLEECWRYFAVGVLAHFFLQLGVVVAATCAFGSSGQMRKLLA